VSYHPATAFEAIADRIVVGSCSGAVLDKKEFISPEPWIVRPCAIPEIAATIVFFPKNEMIKPPGLFKKAVIHHAKAVVNSYRGMHKSIFDVAMIYSIALA
jgi:hypothetical protein